MAIVSAGHDVVINATRPASGQENTIASTTKGLMDGLARSGVRLLVVGGAATLTVPGTGGKTVLEDKYFLPIAARHIGKASSDQLDVCMSEKRVDWVYLSPPAQLVPGKRTGVYRMGGDELLLDKEGDSVISMEDLAVALLDETETPRHHQSRFTVAY
jgi:putative NADH-flavin reductase